MSKEGGRDMSALERRVWNEAIDAAAGVAELLASGQAVNLNDGTPLRALGSMELKPVQAQQVTAETIAATIRTLAVRAN